MRELIEEAQKYILKNIHIGMRLDGLYRVDVPEISVAAMREAIINAFCHRDYHDPDYVQVAIFKDRVEIRNPGKLYGNLTIEKIRKGNVSQRRNPLIAELLRRIQMVETWGRGMRLILAEEPTVQFSEVAQLFIAAFNRPSYAESDKPIDKTPGKSLGKTPGKIVELLRGDPGLTIPELAEHVGKSESAVERAVRKLREAGHLKRVGPAKGGYWEVVK
jgi:ATP-dependent DNA helicase RecG